MERRRAVITGIGVVSSVGNNKDEFFKSLLSGESGICEINKDNYPHHVFRENEPPRAGLIKNLDPSDYFSKEEIDQFDYHTLTILKAVDEAIKDSGVLISNHRFRVIIGSVGSLLPPYNRLNVSLKAYSGGKSSALPQPQYYPAMAMEFMMDTVLGAIFKKFGLKGEGLCLSTLSASGAATISLGSEFIHNGSSDDIVICIGFDHFHPRMNTVFSHFKMLARERCIPFSESSEGFYLSEGIGSVILEDMKTARERRAHIYGEVLGTGTTNDAYHAAIPSPSGREFAKAIEMSIKEANIELEDIDYISLTGRGTKISDIKELEGIRRVFGHLVEKIPVNSITSYTGYTQGAGSILNFIAALLQMKENIILPILNFDVPYSNYKNMNFVKEILKRDLNITLVCCHAFTGVNIAIVVKGYKNLTPALHPSSHGREGTGEGDIFRMNKRGVVITGIGVLSGYGQGREIFWSNLRDNIPVFREITGVKMEPLKSRLGGQIAGFKLKEQDPSLLRANKFCQYSFAAASMAIRDAGIYFRGNDTYKTGILIGTKFGHPVIQGYRDMLEPVRSQYINPNAAASLIAISNGIRGPIMSITAGESTSASAVELGVNLIRWGKCDTVLAGGTEVLSRLALLYYLQLDEISPAEDASGIVNDERCIPFDKSRNGAIFSEGSAFVVMEEKEHARERGAKVYCEIAGCGSSFTPGLSFNNSDSGHIEISMKRAIENSGVSKTDIGLIYGAANGGKKFDKVESEAIEKVFNGADNPYISSIKSIIGETQGASGIFNLIIAIFTLEIGMVVPIIGFEKGEYDLNFVKSPVYAEINSILCNSISYSGSSVSIILSRGDR